MRTQIDRIIKNANNNTVEGDIVKPLSNNASVEIKGSQSSGEPTTTGLTVTSSGKVEVPAPTSGNEVVNKTFADANYVQSGSGSTPTFDSVTINNTPSANTDATTKLYVDNRVAAGPASVFYGFYLADSEQTLKYNNTADNAVLDFDTYPSFIITSGTSISITNNKLRFSM